MAWKARELSDQERCELGRRIVEAVRKATENDRSLTGAVEDVLREYGQTA